MYLIFSTPRAKECEWAVKLNYANLQLSTNEFVVRFQGCSDYVEVPLERDGSVRAFGLVYTGVTFRLDKPRRTAVLTPKQCADLDKEWLERGFLAQHHPRR